MKSVDLLFRSVDEVNTLIDATPGKTFIEAQPGTIFASGSAPDSPEGLHMTGSGKTIYWVAVKGGNNDWALYCGWEDDPQYLKRHGDKVLSTENIRNVMIAPDALLARYRK